MQRRMMASLVLAVMLSGCGAGPVARLAVAPPATQAQSWLGGLGWYGEDGLRRATATFSKEEGRKVAFTNAENGGRLSVELTPAENDILMKIVQGSPDGQKKVNPGDVPYALYTRAVRHLKLLRRQGETNDWSISLKFSYTLGPDKKPVAMCVRTKNGYQAYYTLPAGKLMMAWAYHKGRVLPAENAGVQGIPEDKQPDE